MNVLVGLAIALGVGLLVDVILRPLTDWKRPD